MKVEQNPIYTAEVECQDCYKCLRECPVKSIEIHNGHAQVIPETCIMCGHCVTICPIGAKKVRNDLEKAKSLFVSKRYVIVSLAPSWVAEFTDLDSSQLISAIKKLGFFGVSETALGAQEVSAAAAELLSAKEQDCLLSSACPTAVKLITHYYPELTEKITPLASPLLVHCAMLRRLYPNDCGIVFVGPCIAKKGEADSHPDLLDCAISFKDLADWFKQEKIDPWAEAIDQNVKMLSHVAEEGALYPLDGGMIAGIKSNCSVKDANLMTFSGIKDIQEALQEIETIKSSNPLFMELLACDGGCINGPGMNRKGATASKRISVISAVKNPSCQIPRKARLDITEKYEKSKLNQIEYSKEEITEVLFSIGKQRPEDELNCSGCGYSSCQEFAKAIIGQHAEKNMCVSYMRKLASKKADLVIQKMPSGMVIVDQNLKIVECNYRALELLGLTENTNEDLAKIVGTPLDSILPFGYLFQNLLDTGSAARDKKVNFNNTILYLTVFTIEPNQMVGCIIQDISKPNVRKQEIVRKAEEVRDKQLKVVQQIAYLLGENAAESEIILRSITDAFSVNGEEDAS